MSNSLSFPVFCVIFPDFSLTGKCLPIFPGFPVRVGTLSEWTVSLKQFFCSYFVFISNVIYILNSTHTDARKQRHICSISDLLYSD